MQVFERHGKRYRVYRCPRARVDACANTFEAPMAEADDAALEIFESVLSPAGVERAGEAGRNSGGTAGRRCRSEACSAGGGAPADRTRNRESDAAIASGDAPDALVAALRAREREAKTAATELRAMDVPVARVEDAEVRAEASKLLVDWRSLFAAQHLGRAAGTDEAAGRGAREVLSDRRRV
jgi:hypothetical protein